MTLCRPVTPPLRFLSAALIAVFGFVLAPAAADAQPPDDRDRLVVIRGDALDGLDIDALVDQALRTASLALESVDIARVVDQSLSAARIDEAVAMALGQVDAGRIQDEVDRALADVNVEREIDRALEQVRDELRSEDIGRMVHEALEDLDIDRIVREATEHAREHRWRYRRE